MGNNDLENKIINNVRNRIVVSNLEKEADMKISKRKAIISLTAMIVIFLSGSFLTVNAATDGQLAQDVKDMITLKFDTTKYKQRESKEGVDEKGNKYYEYRLESLDGESEVDIITYKDADVNVDYTITEENAETEKSVTSEITITDNK